MTAVELEGVSKQFRLSTIRPPTTLKTAALVERLLGRQRATPEPVSRVLRSIDLTIPRGQTFGIIGRNGSGKSTLLKLMAGIYRPDAGRIRVHGQAAGLLELGAGFHPDFSGLERRRPAGCTYVPRAVRFSSPEVCPDYKDGCLLASSFHRSTSRSSLPGMRPQRCA